MVSRRKPLVLSKKRVEEPTSTETRRRSIGAIEAWKTVAMPCFCRLNQTNLPNQFTKHSCKQKRSEKRPAHPAVNFAKCEVKIPAKKS